MNRFLLKVENLKRIAKMLIEKTFPKCSIGEDSDLSILKTNYIVIDGYDCGIFHSISDFGKYKIYILQIWPTYNYFIPFNVVVKIVKKFFGDKNPQFIQIWNNEKMLYCWSLILDKDEKTVSNFYDSKQEQVFFEDFKYYLIEPGEINII